MRSANSYQDIKTSEEEEVDLCVESIYESLLADAREWAAENGENVSSLTKCALRQRAREIYNNRKEEEEEDE